MLAATPAELERRRADLAQSPVLARLRDRLRAGLGPVLEEPVRVPREKAWLTRDGGVCPDDGSRLGFDPLSPEAHRCPRCGRVLAGERHYRAWLTRYHVWLSERALRLALLARLTGEAALAERATEILARYAAQYPAYANRDNVLGPTRIFFSTYLESIWLCQVTIAGSLLPGGAWEASVHRMAAESAALIASFDEGWSNRQVWNNTALVAAGRWLDDSALVRRGLDGPHGLRAQLSNAVSADGFWFEGENYHFFALRGLQLAAELLRRGGGGVDLYKESGGGRESVLGRMHRAPLSSLLPDLTLPARGDSPFGVSVRQPRFAELWEIGWTRTGDAALEAMLGGLYAACDLDPANPGVADIAEIEQNRPPACLSRDQLGWRALLWMTPEAPRSPAGRWQPGSCALPDHGLAVLRRGARYAAMECGGRPGGHGHPDLLHVSLFQDGLWLADPGTGSYVSRSLFWYRSTLAHNAPGGAGVGQVSRAGWLAALEERDGWAWCQAVASGPFGEGTVARRSLVVGPAYVLDVVDIEAAAGVPVDLPIHPLGTLVLPAGASREPVVLAPVSGAGHETGYDAVTGWARVDGALRFSARSGERELAVTLAPRGGETVYLATAPGPPDLSLAEARSLEFLMRRAAGPGRWAQVYAAGSGAVRSVECRGDRIRVEQGDGTVDTFRVRIAALEIETAGSRLTLAGPVARRAAAAPTPAAAPVVPCPRLEAAPPLDAWESVLPPEAVRVLGREHYRRSEEPYDPARLSARVGLFALGDAVGFAVMVAKPDLVFRRQGDADPGLDNETPDIHSDGVQCYVGGAGWRGVLLVPDPDSARVRARAVAGLLPLGVRNATWERAPNGYRMLFTVQADRVLARGDRVPVNLVINEMHPGRVRRAGQLALSGDGGWTYLRGDREPPGTAVIAEVG